MNQASRRPQHRESRESGADEVQCFIQGARFEGRAVRLSEREALLSLPEARQPPPGTLIGMTFPARRRGPFGVFLYGRAQAEDRPSAPLRVRWEQAVTAGSPEDMRGFLEEVLGIRDAEVREEPWGPRQETRRIFLFPPGEPDPPDPDVASAAPVTEDPDDRPQSPEPEASGESRDLEDPLEGLELEVIALRADGTPLERPEGPASRPSARPLPGDGLRDLSPPLPGRLEAEGLGMEVSLVSLGPSGARVRSPFLPARPEEPLELVFRIPTRRGEATVRCRCQVQEASEGRILLALLGVLEESSPGVLDRYRRYLEIRPGT